VILYTLLFVPLIGIFLISSVRSYYSVILKEEYLSENNISSEINFNLPMYIKDDKKKINFYKKIAFITSIVNLIISLIIYILFDFSNNQFQFIQEHYDLSFYDIYLGVDGISIYFVLLTTIIMPIAILSN
jgi:NADH-ubiquinone oxidoreductase chain 4